MKRMKRMMTRMYKMMFKRIKNWWKDQSTSHLLRNRKKMILKINKTNNQDLIHFQNLLVAFIPLELEALRHHRCHILPLLC